MTVRAFLVLVAIALPLPAGAGDFPDMPADVYETGIEFIDQLPGRYEWLDSDNLAVTTYRAKGAQFWDRKVVAVSWSRRHIKTLVEHASLICTNPVTGRVSIGVGNHEHHYTGGRSGPPPTPRRFQWSSLVSDLSDAPVEPTERWNPYECVETLKAHMGQPNISTWSMDTLYLQPDGSRLLRDPRADSKDVYLIRGADRPILLDVKWTEILPLPSYAPFSKEHVLNLAGGILGDPEYAPRKLKEYEHPLLLMSENGKISRMRIPAAFWTKVKGPASRGETYRVLPGLLVHLHGPGRANGEGLNLVRSDGSGHRVWCTTQGKADPPEPIYETCKVSDFLKISPDGCKVAFVADYPPRRPSATLDRTDSTLKIIDICDTR